MTADRGGTRCYQGAIPTQDADPAFVALANAMTERDEAWKHCLIQIDRASVFAVAFSNDDTHNWKSTVADHDRWVESLRPSRVDSELKSVPDA